MKRSTSRAPIRKPALKPHVGPNWKLIRNLFVIAGLLFAISIAWERLHEAKAKRREEQRQAAAKQAAAYEKALAEAQALSEARRRALEVSAPPVNQAPLVPPQPDPPVEALPEPGRQAAEESSAGTPAEFAPPAAAAEPELPAEIITLNTKARELVAAADGKRSAELADNARGLTWDLDAYLRTLPKSEQEVWLPHVNRIKSAISNNRVPSSIPTSSGVELSPKMAELTRYAAEKQEKIDRGFLAESAKIHGAYLRKIRDAIARAETAGQPPLVQALTREIDGASELETWLQTLGHEASPASSTPW